MSRQIIVGNIKIGGGAPITIQSMTNTDTADIDATVRQVNSLEKAGCEIVRIAVPDYRAADAFKQIKENTRIPLVADIHFNHNLAIKAAENGADKIRINPGNIGAQANVKLVADACRERKIPIRIGVNSGSIAKNILAKWDGICAEAMLESAETHIRLLEDCGFDDICVSMKSSSVPLTVKSNKLFRQKFDYPLHIGVTHIGGGTIGSPGALSAAVKASVGIGSLLLQNIGDTLRVSMLGDPLPEVQIAQEILYATGIRVPELQIITCPTCGRCKVDLSQYSDEVTDRLRRIQLTDKHITVAVMGCEVNGPGEAKECDFGLACGPKNGILFANGETVRKVPIKSAAAELCLLIEKSFQ